MKRRSEIGVTSNSQDTFNLQLFENALKDPNKRNAVLELLASQNKSIFQLFKNRPADASKSPVKRIKRKNHCESPTALFRRRELEKINRPNSAHSTTSELSSTSEKSSAVFSTVPFSEIMKGVKAFVEIKSKGHDRSGGAKALLRSMGATVCEKFTKDVTHVIFKDGSYETFQRAKLLKVNFVSVLWLEASRTSGFRAIEDKFPALGTQIYDQNISMICSQMQKDYEDVVREELKFTLQSGNLLPCELQKGNSRRKTIANTTTDLSSTLLDQEVENISSRCRKPSKDNTSLVLCNISPSISDDDDELNMNPLEEPMLLEITNDDSESLISRCLSNRRRSDMELTNLAVANNANEVGQAEVQDSGLFQKLKHGILNSLSYLSSGKQNEEEFNDVRSPEEDIYQLATPKLQTLKKRYISLKENSEARGNNTLEGNKENVPAGTIDESYSRIINDSEKNGVDSKQINSDVYMCKTPTLTINSCRNILSSRQNESSMATQNLDSQNKLDTGMSLYRISSDSEDKSNCNKKTVLGKNHLLGVSSESNENNDDAVTLSLGLSDNSNKKCFSKNEINAKQKSPLRASTESNKKRDDSTMSSLRISDSFEKNSFSRGKTSSIEMSSLRRSDNAERNESSKNGTDFTDMSLKISNNAKRSHSSNNKTVSLSLRVSGNSTKKRFSNNGKNAKHKSPLCVSSESNKNCDDSMMSSLRISDSFKNNSFTKDKTGSTEMSSLRISDDAERNKSSKNGTGSTDMSSLRISDNARRSQSSKDKTDSTDMPSLINCHSPKSVSLNSSSERISSEVQLIVSYLNEEDDSSFICKKTGISEESDSLVSTKGEENNKLLTPFVTDRKKKKKFRKEKNEDCNKKINDIHEIMSKNDSNDHSSLRNINLQIKGDKDSDQMYSTPFVTQRKKRKVPRSSKVNTSDNNLEQVIDNGIDPTINDGNANKNTNIKRNLRNEMDKSEIKTQRSLRISRSVSEPNIQNATLRRSRRIRKLFDPEDVAVGETVKVDDAKEREIIRKEKETKSNEASNDIFKAGNVLLTKKAMEYLKNAKSNKNDMKAIFKSPEILLQKLGIPNDVDVKKLALEDSLDEQTELANEFVHKKQRPSRKMAATQPTPRKSTRSATQAIQKTSTFSATQVTPRRPTRAVSKKNFTPSTQKRRSTLDFQTNSQVVRKVGNKLKVQQKPTIVCTKMHRSDVQMLFQIVKKLGTFEVEDEVSSRTTHLVVGEAKRTINMLRAIARGCWILNQEWLFNSLEDGKWLPEEKYEVVDFSPTVQRCRLERLAFGPSYTMNIFLSCGLIYVAKCTTPRSTDLRELIVLCKGKLARMPDNANIVVGAYLEGRKSVSEYWILDSISSGKLKTPKKYLLRAEDAPQVGKSPFV